MSANEKIDPHYLAFDRLSQAASKALAEKGLKLLHFTPVARLDPKDDGPRMVEMVMQFDPNGVDEPSLELVVETAMGDAAAESYRENLEKSVEEARKEVGDLYKPGRKGFLD